MKITAFAVVALVFGIILGHTQRAVVFQAEAALDAEEQAFLTLINDYREGFGLGPPLFLNTELNNAAEWMSNDMAAKDYFSHTDSLGRDPFQRMAAFGYNYDTLKGENLAAGVDTAQAVLDLWKGSPEHNALMLTPDFRVIGIGRAYGEDSTYGWYWVTDFGGLDPTPATPTPTPTPTPAPTPTPCPDSDSDGVCDSADNCPAWPNPGQSLPPWPVPSGDPDCDGFTDGEETFVGTDATDACPDDPDDDVWPADLVHTTLGYGQHDGTVNILDIVQLTPPYFNTSLPDPNYNIRKDFNGDSAINILDIVRLTPPVFNLSCTP